MRPIVHALSRFTVPFVCIHSLTDTDEPLVLGIVNRFPRCRLTVAAASPRRRVTPPPRLTAAASLRRRAPPPPRLPAAPPPRRGTASPPPLPAPAPARRRAAPPQPRPAAAPLRRRVSPPPRRSAVSDGQALYHFRGQMRCWPRLVDCGQEGKLMGVADAPIGTPRRRVATLLRGLTFGSTTSRGPTSVSSAVLRRARALASASTTPLPFAGL